MHAYMKARTYNYQHIIPNSTNYVCAALLKITTYMTLMHKS